MVLQLCAGGIVVLLLMVLQLCVGDIVVVVIDGIAAVC